MHTRNSWPLTLVLGSILAMQLGCKTDQQAKTSEVSSISDKPRVDGMYCAAQKQSPRPAPNGSTPNGYAIFSVILHNIPGYLKYYSQAEKLIFKHHGKPVLRGPNFLNELEGNAFGQSFAIVEFASMKNLDDFYCSPEYQPDIIQQRLDSTFVVFSVVKEGDSSSTGVDSSSAPGDVKAFVLFNDTVTDSAAYDSYLSAATALASASGGRRLFSGGNHTEIEAYAENKPDNLTLFVFPNMDKLHAWYDSKAYKVLMEKRLKASKVKFVLAKEGVEL